MNKKLETFGGIAGAAMLISIGFFSDFESNIWAPIFVGTGAFMVLAVIYRTIKK